jgi:hypothetical protein
MTFRERIKVLGAFYRLGSLGREVPRRGEFEQLRGLSVAVHEEARDRGVRGPVVPGRTPNRNTREGRRASPAVGDDDDRSPGAWRASIMVTASSKRARISSSVSAPTMAHRSFLGHGEELLGELGIAGLLLGPGVTLQQTAVTLRQAGHGDHLAS